MRRLGEPALLAADDVRRQRPTGGLESAAGDAPLAARVDAAAVGASRATPCAVPPDSTSKCPPCGTLVAGGSRPRRLARPGSRRATVPRADRASRSPSHSDVPTRGRNSTSGWRAAQGVQLGPRQMLTTYQRAGWAAAASQRSTSATWPLAERQVERACPRPGRRRATRPPAASACVEAVPRHRGQRLEDDPRCAAARSAARPGPRAGRRCGRPGRRSERRANGSPRARAPGCRRRSVAGPRATSGRCRPRWCRHRASRPCGPAGQAEAVAVALGDRDQARVRSATCRRWPASAGRRRTGSAACQPRRAM